MNVRVYLLFVVLFLAACDYRPAPNVSLQVQDFGTANVDIANDVTANATGVYAVGHTEGSLDGPSKGSEDAFVRKYDGAVVWAQQFGTRTNERAEHVAATDAGNVYVLGATEGALGFNIGSADCFLRRYDTSGAVKWTRQFGTTSYDYPNDIALDAQGNIYTLHYNATFDDQPNFIVYKWNSSGQVLWTITVPLTTSEVRFGYAESLAVDTLGNVYVAAKISYQDGRADVILYKFSSAGVTLAGYPKPIYASPNQDQVYDMKLDSGNNIYMLLYKGGDGTGTGQAQSLLRKTSSSGTWHWTKSLNPTGVKSLAFATSLAVDSNNKIYVGGYTEGKYSGFTNMPYTRFDLFVLKYNTAGTRLWTQQFGTGGQDVALGVAVSDAVYLTGYTDSAPYANLIGAAPYGEEDAFLARLDIGTGAILGIDQ